jgi:predicted ferric reductase
VKTALQTTESTTRIAPASRRPRPLARPTQLPFVGSDVVAFLAFFVLVVTAVWATRGGWQNFTDGWSGLWRGAASLSGIWTSLAGMAGLLLAARFTWMERAAGLDRLLVWHRIVGDSMGLLLGVHIFTSIVAEMPLRGGFVNTVIDLTGREPYMALTTVGAGLIAVVIVSSLRAFREKLSFETWYFVHLTAYVGLAMSFSHQITLGSLLSTDRTVRAFWVLLSIYAFAVALFGRWISVMSAARHPLRVASIDRINSDTVAVVLGGRNIDRYTGDAGQFIMMRSLIHGQWWKVNPYSLSAAPSTEGMRVTIKDRGDASAAIARLRVGDRVAVEGPYGITTPDIFQGRRPLMIAGGVGITPVRAMLERLDENSQPLVLLRGRNEQDIPHLEEIAQLTKERGGEVLTLLGRTAALKVNDPFSPQILRGIVPFLDDCVVFVCGPTSLTFAARKGLKEAGVPTSRIHLELPWW